MRLGDIVLCTFQEDVMASPDTYAGEIVDLDFALEKFSLKLFDDGLNLRVDFSPWMLGAWSAHDDSGGQYSLVKHYVYRPENASPNKDDVALLLFDDGQKFLCIVEDVTDGVALRLYHQPYPRLLVEGSALRESEWHLHGPGTKIYSLQLCRILGDISMEGPGPVSGHVGRVVSVVDKIDGSNVCAFEGDQGVIFFENGFSVNADGAHKAYHPDSARGLDNLGNAGRPGNWWGIVTDDGSSAGIPLVQDANDLAPGFYISTTSLFDPERSLRDPERYVDSVSVPYFAMPSNAMFGLSVGDLGVVVNAANWRFCACVFADVGGKNKIGEGSIALAKELGIPSSPRNGGVSGGVVYVLFPGSSIGWPVAVADIKRVAEDMFGRWGGVELVREILPSIVR